MFLKHSDATLSDLTIDLRDEDDWKLQQLRVLDFPLDISCFAIEPVARILAIGTASGTIHIFGRSGVECKLTLPNTSGARLLGFALSTYHLLAIDNENQLHIYDLLEIGRPNLVASARFDKVNSMTVSPSHSHVFLAIHNGDIKTYDIGCLRKSSYTMPNMWKLYEEKMAKDGIPSLAAPIPSHPVDTVIHPRNLNLVFVAYSGGIILTDLAERSTVRAYEYVLPPGAPGGAGYGLGQDILTHRKLEVTSLAVHPSGHFFAVGHADGSIAFWAVEDEKRPILVRTLDSDEVDTVDEALLELHLQDHGKESPPQAVREPIFKLSWSGYANSRDPRGGQTTLTVLGGISSNKPPGLTVQLLPAFNPPEPPAASNTKQGTLHPLFKQAMRDSLDPVKTYYYQTSGIIQDYLLIPRSSPHWAGTYDPYTILMIIENDQTRTVEAFQFPPPGFITPSQLPTSPLSATSEEDDYYYEDTFSPKTGATKSPGHAPTSPSRVDTPLSLLLGNNGLLGGNLLKLENQVYHDFIDRTISSDLHMGLKGGNSYPNKTKLNELKLSKHHPHRVMITYDADLTVRFFDVSPQLFIPPSGPTLSLESEWPKPLSGLTIQLNDLLDDTSILECLLAPADRLAISSVHLAPEALECAIVLESGEVLVYHSRNSSPPDPSKSMADTEIILLNQARSRAESRLVPFFMLVAGKGPVEACAISDIGIYRILVSWKMY
ncbi:hypothetical protein CVT24_009781 [Panaeolus cyanescens]|uniref:Lethal giant larvae (Lgl)-like C-terminal domain-containing protein n=1 Tax=Panaeolus cyanescens TaxID=181874 RepID=A0A409VAE2_9AGAR|nr:hypothetical protein CVT24_009781 [Panaeolus cyanescens]